MLRFAFSLALRSLQYKPGLSALTVGIVAISVMLIIALSTLMDGVKKRMVSTVTESMPHISVYPSERTPHALWQERRRQRSGRLYIGKMVKLAQTKKKIEEWKPWLPRIRKLTPQIVAAAAVAGEQATLFRGAQPHSVRVEGVRPGRYNQVLNIQKKLVKGQFLRMATGQMVVGYTLAEELSLELGDKVRLAASTGGTAIFTVVGMFFTGSQVADEGRVYIPLRDAQSLFGLGHAVTHLQIKVDDIYLAEALGKKVQSLVPYQVRDWMTDNQNLLTAIQTQGTTSNVILLLTTIASGFGIASILIMAVVGKLRELGILIAMGASRGQIVMAYTFQGLLISCMGALLGLAGGVGVTQLLISLRKLDRLGRSVQMFPVETQYGVIVFALIVAIVVGLVASVFPAWQASRVNPIDVIRGG